LHIDTWKSTLMAPPLNAVRALLFDVFGTCVDWRSSVVEKLEEQCHASLNDATKSLATSLRLRATDMSPEAWGEFVQAWRNTYITFCKTLAADPSIPWKTVDEHHLDALRELLTAWNLEGLWDDEQIRALSLVWHFLHPWPDAPDGIKELNGMFSTCTLSNGNLSLLRDLCVYAQLSFGQIFSAELFGSYKPSPKAYLGAVDKLGLKPVQCAMVAAHLGDLKAAKDCGLTTIYVERPNEETFSKEEIEKARRDGFVDLWITGEEKGFISVAEKLSALIERN
jgi:2-haloacid dehalogenase